MGSSPSKRKLSNFSIKDALPVRFNNNNFHESNPNGTVKPADRREEHQKVLIKQPQQAENLPSNPQAFGSFLTNDSPRFSIMELSFRLLNQTGAMREEQVLQLSSLSRLQDRKTTL